MNKSILVIETPDICIDCPCHFAEETGKVWCGRNGKEILADDIEDFKPDWCPLKDIPEKKSENIKEVGLISSTRNEGWNLCIDEILKEVFENPAEYNWDNIGGID